MGFEFNLTPKEWSHIEDFEDLMPKARAALAAG
jgi:hypothetical protein